MQRDPLEEWWEKPVFAGLRALRWVAIGFALHIGWGIGSIIWSAL